MKTFSPEPQPSLTDYFKLACEITRLYIAGMEAERKRKALEEANLETIRRHDPAEETCRRISEEEI